MSISPKSEQYSRSRTALVVTTGNNTSQFGGFGLCQVFMTYG